MPKVASLTLSTPASIDSSKGPHFPGARLEVHNLNSNHERPYTHWTDQIARCSDSLKGLWRYFYEFSVDNAQVIDFCTKLHNLNLSPSSTDTKCNQVFCLINVEGLQIDCEDSTETCLTKIFKLKGLKRLNLHDVKSDSKQFLRELGTKSTVLYFDLTGAEVNASVIRGLRSLRS